MNTAQHRHTKNRYFKNALFKLAIWVFTIATALPLILIFGDIFQKGLSVINWEFFTSIPAPLGEQGGGVAHALIGTIILILIAAVLATPPGILLGVYLSEYKETKLAYYAEVATDVLQGIPSIIIGIIVALWFVDNIFGKSAIAGGIALAFIMFPIVVKSTQETLKLLPHSLKEASLALGAPYWVTIVRIVIPAGLSGILNGIILGIARISGETAPLLFTAFGNLFMNSDIFQPISSLPHLIFNYAISPYDEWHRLAWGAAVILLSMILIMNLGAKYLQKKWQWY